MSPIELLAPNAETAELGAAFLPVNAGPTLAAVAALDAAVIKARGNFAPVLKTGNNPAFRSKYAPLDSVLEAVLPALSAEGLSISSGLVEEAGAWRVLTTLSHVGGGWRVSRFPVADLAPQKVGSALTYAMRYGVSALLSLAAEEDDDGNAASQGKAWSPKANADVASAPAAPAPAGRPLF